MAGGTQSIWGKLGTSPRAPWGRAAGAVRGDLPEMGEEGQAPCRRVQGLTSKEAAVIHRFLQCCSPGHNSSQKWHFSLECYHCTALLGQITGPGE